MNNYLMRHSRDKIVMVCAGELMLDIGWFSARDYDCDHIIQGRMRGNEIDIMQGGVENYWYIKILYSDCQRDEMKCRTT